MLIDSTDEDIDVSDEYQNSDDFDSERDTKSRSDSNDNGVNLQNRNDISSCDCDDNTPG